MNRSTPTVLASIVLTFLLLFVAPAAGAYGVLTHQAIIDAAWQDGIEPLLRKRFPNASEEAIKKAQAYTYGGSIVQDMGYFPFGNTFFTDLTHYVRSGDFVENMLRSAGTVEEYAYTLTDKTYAELVHKLYKSNFKHLTPPLRQNILQFYQSGKATEKLDADEQQEIKQTLAELKAF